jgi:hypothetical protein
MTASTVEKVRTNTSSRTTSWESMVRRSWGEEYTLPDKPVYEFTGGRQFESTDKGTTGVYGVRPTPPFEFDYDGRPTHFDVDTTLMVSDQDSTELLFIDPDTSIPHNCPYSTSAYPGISLPGCAIPSSTGA